MVAIGLSESPDFCWLLRLIPGKSTARVAPAQSGIQLEEWVTRYPKEHNDWKDSVHGVAYLSDNSDAPGCPDCHLGITVVGYACVDQVLVY